MGRTTWWGKVGELTGIMDHLPGHNRQQFLDKKFGEPWVQQESTFWRRSVWDVAGGTLKTDLDFAGDMELWVRFFRHADLHTVNALLGGYRGHGDQKAVHSMDKYMAEAYTVIDAELEFVKTEAAPRLADPPKPVEIDYASMHDWICSVLPAGQRPNLSGHQTYIHQQNQLTSLDVLASRLRENLDELAAGAISAEQFTRSLSWRLTAPLRRLVDLVRSKG